MPNLLIVDDDNDLADVVAELMIEDGHSVRVAHNGQEGLERVDEAKPDLVLLDVDMPILSGPEMAYQLFVLDCGKEKIPVVLISGNVRLAGVALSVGTPYCLAKPYTEDALRTVVASALRERTPPDRSRGRPS